MTKHILKQGDKNNMLTFIKVVEDIYLSPKGQVHQQILCQCDCGNFKVLRKTNFMSGGTKSCGCLNKKTSRENGKKSQKYNTYNLTGEYGIGWASNTNKEFYFDLEDYNKIKDYCWREDNKGYICTSNKENKKPKCLMLHDVIMDNICENYLDKDFYVNHIKRKNDNRKLNLRLLTESEYKQNHKTRSDNTIGYSGIKWNAANKKWQVDISINKKRRYVGLYPTIEDAIEARKEAENTYYVDFSEG